MYQGGYFMDMIRSVLDEIKMHHRVAGYKILSSDELEISFIGNYRDLIIPITPKMSQDNILTVFYYYIANFGGK